MNTNTILFSQHKCLFFHGENKKNFMKEDY